MPSVTINDSHSESFASVCPGRGFNCFEFRADVDGRIVDVLATDFCFVDGSTSPSHDGIPILFPFPNRIRDGRYSWDGREYQLPLTEGHPHMLHGFVLDRAWRVVEQGDSFVKGQFQLSVDAPDRLELWPCDFILEVTYTIAGASLTMDVTVQNPDDKPLPWGFGTHSYFKLPLGEGSRVESCLVQTPAHQEWVLDECMPTGERRNVSENADLREGVSLAGRKLDDVLTDLRSDADMIDTIVTDPQAGLRMVQSFPKDFRELVVFTPPWTDAVCMEPYTCVTDAINLQPQGIDAGWRTLDPGDSFTTQIVIRVERV
ncbi:MAG: aldose 1-epimerase [Planctomycetaceae bacterium]|nr:aldose 1-epimerase [Planctomycetaceae bacterium]